MSSYKIAACRIAIVLATFLISCCTTRYSDKRHSSQNDSRIKIIANTPNPIEFPKISNSETVIRHLAYAVSYNSTTLNPNWVAYELTQEEADGDVVSRKGRNFIQDPEFAGKQADYYDYNNTGWDKGHLAPAADMKWSITAMDESFYFTNCSPQNHDFNDGMWKSLENNVRSWARKYGRVYVIAGPIFSSKQYGTIGTDQVWIPDAFYKACIVPKGEDYSGIGFVMNNTFLSGNLGSYGCTIDELESILGKDLFCGLDDDVENEVESVVKWEDWGLPKPKANLNIE